MKKVDAKTPGIYRQLTCKEIDKSYLVKLIEFARDEDMGGEGLIKNLCPNKNEDPTTEILGLENVQSSAVAVARKKCVIAGLFILPEILSVYGGHVQVEIFVKDGEHVMPGTKLCRFFGNVAELLSAERVLLNFLQRMCGIATTTAEYVMAMGKTKTRLLDTRKTTPGHRVLDKYSVACGGAWNHRIGLFDRVMVKDNHLAADDAVIGERLFKLVQKSKATRPDLLCEVEVDSIEQIPFVLKGGADIILLDNFSIEDLKSAIKLIGDQAWTEISGGVSKETLPVLAKLGADFISCGALTHHLNWIDIGLDWE